MHAEWAHTSRLLAQIANVVSKRKFTADDWNPMLQKPPPQLTPKESMEAVFRSFGLSKGPAKKLRKGKS